MEGIWFPDEAEELKEWRNWRQEALLLENEHLEIRVALRDAEAILRDDPGNENLKARVKYLKKRLAELDNLAPWISSDIPIEVLLFGRSWGC